MTRLEQELKFSVDYEGRTATVRIDSNESTYFLEITKTFDGFRYQLGDEKPIEIRMDNKRSEQEFMRKMETILNEYIGEDRRTFPEFKDVFSKCFLSGTDAETIPKNIVANTEKIYFEKNGLQGLYSDNEGNFKDHTFEMLGKNYTLSYSPTEIEKETDSRFLQGNFSIKDETGKVIANFKLDEKTNIRINGEEYTLKPITFRGDSGAQIEGIEITKN